MTEVRKYLIPDSNDEIRQTQMREMEIIRYRPGARNPRPFIHTFRMSLFRNICVLLNKKKAIIIKCYIHLLLIYRFVIDFLKNRFVNYIHDNYIQKVELRTMKSRKNLLSLGLGFTF